MEELTKAILACHGPSSTESSEQDHKQEAKATSFVANKDIISFGMYIIRFSCPSVSLPLASIPEAIWRQCPLWKLRPI